MKKVPKERTFESKRPFAVSRAGPFPKRKLTRPLEPFRNTSPRTWLARQSKTMEEQMTTLKILGAAAIAATLVGPAIAQEATQEPGAMGKNYPHADYLTGGYGARATPGPRYYYRHHYYGPGPVGLAGL